MDGWAQQRLSSQMAAFEAARQKRRRMREEFAEARCFGLAARHAAKLKRNHVACTVDADGTVRCVNKPPYDAICPRRPAVTPGGQPTAAAKPPAAVGVRPPAAVGLRVDARPATVGGARPSTAQTSGSATAQTRSGATAADAQPSVVTVSDGQPAVQVRRSGPAEPPATRETMAGARPVVATAADARPAVTVSDARLSATQALAVAAKTPAAPDGRLTVADARPSAARLPQPAVTQIRSAVSPLKPWPAAVTVIARPASTASDGRPAAERARPATVAKSPVAAVGDGWPRATTLPAPRPTTAPKGRAALLAQPPTAGGVKAQPAALAMGDTRSVAAAENACSAAQMRAAAVAATAGRRWSMHSRTRWCRTVGRRRWRWAASGRGVTDSALRPRFARADGPPSRRRYSARGNPRVALRAPPEAPDSRRSPPWAGARRRKLAFGKVAARGGVGRAVSGSDARGWPGRGERAVVDGSRRVQAGLVAVHAWLAVVSAQPGLIAVRATRPDSGERKPAR